MAVSGNGNSSGIHFSLRQDEMASTADLDLSLSYPDAKFADKTHLEVLLNGQLLKNIPLDPFSADGMETHIPIDAALVLSHNDLNFRVVGQAGPQCVDEDSPQQNEVLISNQSKLQFQLVRLPRPRDLSIFPAPFFDEGIMGQVTVPLVLPEHPSQTVLESGAILASYFGEKAQFRTASFPVTLNGLPDNNAIALVVGDNLAGANLPPPTGPELRIIDNPLDPLYKVLVVMGRTDSEVKTAVEYLLSGAALSGQDVAAKAVTLPKRQPYDAPNWVSTQGSTPLGQLTGPEGLVARGLHHGANEVNFRAPPDLFRWRDRPMSMQVQYLFPEGSWMDERRSKLNVSLNGQFLESLPVNNTGIWASFLHLLGNDVRQQKAKVEIPSYLLYGENKLSFYFDLRLHPGSDCKQVLGTKIISRVLPGSSLDLSGSKHFTKLPNLSYFVGAGFPFTRMADLSQTLALLPSNPTTLELQTFFDLIGRMGQDTGYPAYGIEVSKGVKDLDQTAGKDLLVVGSVADIDSGNLLQSSPFQFRQNKLALKPITMADTWKRLISGDWGRQDKAASRQLDAQDNFFGLASFISPADQHRVVVVATASQEQQLPDLVERLQQPQASSQVHGDLVLFQDQQIRSYRVGPRVGTGKMSWEMNLGWYFGNHVLQLLVMMLLCILLGATLIYPYLKHRAKTRLAQDEDNRHE
ncbi:cellulose biosynthesis cyclic di-GMP-binding regulatory protein BcsB [Gallaecimonas mangrovi]|uniref:cellulose biosynthesis cyclic di-GMP-binding regulatory protein BcsB n=1 Tax=Gallaecimonas mangrovi TaxID=2291597 RepID=UPI00300FD854